MVLGVPTPTLNVGDASFVLSDKDCSRDTVRMLNTSRLVETFI